MNLNKFYYFLVVLLCSISFTACSDDDDKQTVPHIELTASMSAFSEGILSFDEENGILSISKALNPQLHSRSATYKRNGLLIRKTAIKSSRPFQCAYYPLTP